MRKSAIIRIVTYSITAVVLCLTLVFSIVSDTNVFRLFSFLDFDSDDNYMNEAELETYKNESVSGGTVAAGSGAYSFSDKINKIEIEWQSGEVIVTAAETDKITVSESSGNKIGESTQMKIYQNGNTLKINFGFSHKGNFSGFNIKSINKTLNVTIPKKIFEEIEIEAVSADITLKNVSAKAIDTGTVSGYISADGINAEELDCETVSGDVRIDGKVTRECSFDSVSGRTSLYLDESVGWQSELSTVSGKFNTDFSVTKNGDAYICGNGDLRVKFNSVSGNAEIMKK